MKTTLMIGTVILACGSMLAQSSQTQQPSGQSTGMSNMQMGSQKSAGMQGMKDHMQQMQAEMQQMKSRVEKMRSDAEKVQDPNTKTALLDNADMWDQFMNHMQSHMGMMMKGSMHHGGMTGMQKKRAQPAAPGQTTPPKPQ
jgi:molecular chaperone GrpE (heat shock protein)